MTTFDPGENLENLKKQSKSLLKSVGENDPESIDRIAPYFNDVNAFKLNDAQLVLAREREAAVANSGGGSSSNKKKCPKKKKKR